MKKSKEPQKEGAAKPKESTKVKESPKIKVEATKNNEAPKSKAEAPKTKDQTKAKDGKEQKDTKKAPDRKLTQPVEAAGKRAQKESKALQKAAELTEKEKWRKAMMLENEVEDDEEENLSEVDEDAFRDGLQLALDRSRLTTTTTTTTSAAATNTQENNGDYVTIHKEISANFDSPIDPITPIIFTTPEQASKKPPKANSKQVALSRAMAKVENGEALSNKERRALARKVDEPPADENIGNEMTDSNLLYALRNFSVSDVSVEKKIEESLTRDIIIERFSISAPQKPLFVHAELRLNHGCRYGLLGPNGQGKTTLLKHIAARVLPIPSHIRVMYVEQEVEATANSAVQTVLQADARLVQLLRKETELIAFLMSPQADCLTSTEWEEKNKQLDTLELELEACEADAAEGRARKILAGLGFSQEMQEEPTTILSGGWRMRVALACALFVDPELLLLDEPTNHLDLSAVIWLESHLQQRKGTLVVVSHDQDFLNNVVTNVMLVEGRALAYFRGDYDDFVAAHESRLAKHTKDFEKQQKALKVAKAKGLSKAEAEAKVVRQAAASKVKGEGESGEAAAATLLTKSREYVVDFQFPAPDDDRPYLQANDLSFQHTATSPMLFKKVSFGVNTTTKAVIVGPNGAGKTTLLGLAAGDLLPTSGEVKRVGGLRIGRYNQHFSDALPMEQTPVSYLQSQFTEQKEQGLRKLLGRFGLESTAHTLALRNLSGGQKARVVFASLALRKPHILCLDEPTNHLDIESINALIRALKAFQGGVLLVSHDARLISSMEAKLWVCSGSGALTFFAGDFSAYRRQVLSNILEADAVEDRRNQERVRQRKQRRATRAYNTVK